jgi:elongation factor Ts
MHVAAFNPVAVTAEAVPAELVAKEKEIAEAKAIESGKPANIVEKMVTGSVEKYLNEVVLERQMYVIDNDKKVADVLKATGTVITQFTRFEVGEGIEKKLNFLSLKKLLLLKPLLNNFSAAKKLLRGLFLCLY